MITKLRKRIESEKGFTLIEMLIVIIILGILIAIAVPAYLGFRDRANQAAAKSNVRAAVPAVEAYASDEDDYTGMTLQKLHDDYDSAIAVDGSVITIVGVPGASYCIQSTKGTKFASKAGPDAPVVEVGC